jgi:hypothetical protein
MGLSFSIHTGHFWNFELSAQPMRFMFLTMTAGPVLTGQPCARLGPAALAVDHPSGRVQRDVVDLAEPDRGGVDFQRRQDAGAVGTLLQTS